MRSGSKFFIFALCFAIVAAVFVPVARADEWNKKTIMTFAEPVQVPGKVLPAGTYIFKLLDSPSNRYIVQIFNADQTELITTIFAIPDYRVKVPENSTITLDERPAGQPEAVKSWFYPGENYGFAFVYPKGEELQVAEAEQPPAPVTEAPQPVAAQEAAPQPAPVEPAPATVTETETVTAVETVMELPQTASLSPLVGLGGFFLLAAAFAVRRLSASAN